MATQASELAPARPLRTLRPSTETRKVEVLTGLPLGPGLVRLLNLHGSLEAAATAADVNYQTMWSWVSRLGIERHVQYRLPTRARRPATDEQAKRPVSNFAPETGRSRAR